VNQTANLDWTAIAIASLGGVMSVVGLLIKRSFGKLDRHMERVERFMEESGKNDVAVALELKHHGEKFAHYQRWLETHEQRLNDQRITQEIHGMVRDIHERGGGQDLERRST
jgi:hypothetical protein